MTTATDAAFFCITRHPKTGRAIYGKSGLVDYAHPLATACRIASDCANVTYGEVFTVDADGAVRVVAVMAVVR